MSPNNTTSYQQQQSQPQQHGRAMTSAASAKEDEVTSSEEAKAFSENENNAEVKGLSLQANTNLAMKWRVREGREMKPRFILNGRCRRNKSELWQHCTITHSLLLVRDPSHLSNI
jgi:hypothetical protein